MRTTVGVALPLVIFAAGCSGSSSSSASKGTPAAPAQVTSGPSGSAPSALANLQKAYTTLVNRTLPSVVEIRTPSGLGSGIVFDTQGDIVTNDHVVGNSTNFRVTLAGSSKSLPAKLVGSYPPDDLAVIKVSGAPKLRPAHFGDSTKVQVGDIVLAMGSPLGLSSSVTNGIVSAVGRTVTEPSGGGSPGAVLPQVIQTSAPINPGNSGGALVSIDGDVIGVPTLAAVDQQIGTGGSAAPGIGFAIPSNVVTDIAGQLVKHGKVVNSHRAALGVTVVGVVDSSDVPAGVGVEAVQPGGGAAKAGVQVGDVIVSIAGTKTPTPAALRTALATLSVGQTVELGILRNGHHQALKVTLGQLAG